MTVSRETEGCRQGDRCRRETREELIAVLTQGGGGGGLWGAGCQPRQLAEDEDQAARPLHCCAGQVAGQREGVDLVLWAG